MGGRSKEYFRLLSQLGVKLILKQQIEILTSSVRNKLKPVEQV